MFNVSILSSSQMYIEELESSDIWEKHNHSFRIMHRLADGTSIGEYFKSRDKHIIIIDTDTDDPDGFSILRSAGVEVQSVCVILTGEKSDFMTVKKALVLGAFDYLVKPVSDHELLDALIRAAAKLNWLYQWRMHPEIDPLCMDIAACILSGGDGLEQRMELLLKLCSTDHPPGGDSFRPILRMQSASAVIYQKICEKLPWISDMIPEPERFVKSLGSAESCDPVELLCIFVNELSHTVNQYYPTDLSGLTKLAVDYILENRFCKLTLADTAEKCFVNKAHLSHVFKLNLGVPFTEYVSGLKMKILRQLMISSDKQLIEIAEMLGYDDYKYMARIFKSIYGITPSEFRDVPNLLEST